jgi:hypothetical protein
MPNESSSRKEIHTHHTVLPEVETLLSVQTAPNAVCSLFHSETEGIRLRLDVDDLGVVRIHTRAQDTCRKDLCWIVTLRP